MKRQHLIFIGIALLFSSFSYQPRNYFEIDLFQPLITTDSIPIPDGFEVIGQALGDLNKDGNDEKVIVYNTPKETDYGTERQIHIYKKNADNWELWHKAIGAILGSEQGGMMGDPFDGIKIERGAIVISHFGGSREKWTYLHRFRFQNNNWELIGTTINYGSACEFFESFDFNTSTGKIVYEKINENCENDENVEKENVNKTFKYKLEKLPIMDGFKVGENEVKLKEINRRFFF